MAIPLPEGSTLVHAEIYPEYRLDVYRGVHGRIYAQLVYERNIPEEKQTKAHMYGRINELGKAGKIPFVDEWVQSAVF